MHLNRKQKLKNLLRTNSNMNHVLKTHTTLVVNYYI